jgi:CRISPR system Cascade subunit CasE
LYLSRLKLNGHNHGVRRDVAWPREMHRTLMHAFPTSGHQQSDFRREHGVLHRIESGLSTDEITLLVQSKTQPDWSPLARRRGYLARADGIAVKRIGDLHSVVLPDRSFRFRLLANPTRKVRNKTSVGLEKNGRRVALRDMDALCSWILRKGEQFGFTICSDRSSTARLLLTIVRMPDRSGPEAGVTLAAVQYDGILVVSDVAGLVRGLREGIGPGKAYGFGLLSLGPGEPY